MLILAIAAILTCILEAPIVYLFLSRNKCQDILLNIVLINVITNVTLNMVLSILRFYQVPTTLFTLIAEGVIPIIEAWMYKYCYRHIPIGKLLFLCYIANLFSYWTGLLLF